MFKLAKAELDTMLVLWDCETPIRPAQLLARLNHNGHTWSISTLQTLLARLWAKGAVRVTNQKRFRHYAPAVTREAYLAGTLQKLLADLNTYSPLSLTTTLVEAGILTEAELAAAEKELAARKKQD